MKDNEKFCLQWNDFKDNATATFAQLRGDTDFADVTLACEKKVTESNLYNTLSPSISLMLIILVMSVEQLPGIVRNDLFSMCCYFILYC